MKFSSFKPVSILLWPLMRIWYAICGFYSFVRGVFVEAQLAAALALVLASLATGMWLVMTSGALNVWRFVLPLKAIGVFVAGFGCFYGGLLLEKVKTKAIALEVKTAGEKAEARAKDLARLQSEMNGVRDDNEQLKKELATVTSERDKVRSELRERKGCGLDVGIVKDVAELNLASVNLTIDKFHGEDWQAPTDSWAMRNSGFSPDPAKRYIGVLRRSCLVKYGIDMRNLKVLDAPRKIVVYGLVPKVTGTMGTKDEWLLAQVQEYGVKRISSEDAANIPDNQQKWSIDDRWYTVDDTVLDFKGSRSLDKSSLQAKKDAWTTQLNEEIEDGCNLKGVDTYVVDMARKLITLLLRPLGKTIEFDDRPVEGIALPSLEDFASHCCGRLLESPEE